MMKHTLFAGLTLAALAGCGGRPSGEVAGSVTYRGKPVTQGEVHLQSKEGVGALARLDGEGKFALAEPLQTGTYAVFVRPPAAEPPMPGTAKKMPASPIPHKAREMTTSGISLTVQPGKNELPIELKD